MPITIDLEQNDGVSIDCSGFKTIDNDDDSEGRESDVEVVNEYNDDTLYEGDDR